MRYSYGNVVKCSTLFEEIMLEFKESNFLKN